MSLFQQLQWEGDDFLSELGAAPKKKKSAPKKAAKAPKAPKVKKAPKAPKPPKAKKAPKPKKAKGPIKKAKAKKAAKKAKAPKAKTPAAKKLKALPPAKKQALKRLVQVSKTPAPGAVFAPSPPPEEEPQPSEAETPEPESSDDSMGPDEESTDMDESTPEDDSEDSGEDEGGDDEAGGDDEMGALSMALKLPRLNVKGLSKGQLAVRAKNAVSSVCSCSGKKADKIRGKLDKKMRKRGYPPGTPDKLLASINTLNTGLSRLNAMDLSTLRARREQGQGSFQAEVLKRLGSTAAKLPKGHPTRKKAKRFIAKHISGILLTAR